MNWDESLAGKYFEASDLAYRNECELEEALFLVFGINTNLPVEAWQPWPFSDFIFDSYDSSFELRGIKDVAWVPTPEQMAQAFALGFSVAWVCYPDGTERCYSPKHLTAEARLVNHPRGYSDRSQRELSLRKEIADLKLQCEQYQAVANVLTEDVKRSQAEVNN